MEMENNLYSPGSSGWTSLRNPEFQEADIWDVFQDAKAPEKISFDHDPSSTWKRLAITPTRTIPKPSRSTSKNPKTNQQSAPVNIPDWSGSSCSKNSTLEDSSSWLSDVQHHVNHRSWESKYDYEEEEEEENGNHVIIPPHELLARKVSRSEILSFSVCEGAGRRLKGRDLSRVRNAVLTKTGFLESN